MAAWKKKEGSLQKKLEKLEPKQEEPPPMKSPKKGRTRGNVKIRGKKGKKKAKPEDEKKEESPEEEGKEETPAEEEKKEEGAEGEGEKEETEEEKKARELAEIKKQIEENRSTQEKIQGKIDAVKAKQGEIEDERGQDKVLDLSDQAGERKFMKSKADEQASEFLTGKCRYQLQRITKNAETEEEEAEGIVIEKSCLLYTSPSPRDKRQSRMPSSA